jgi:RNA polymerase sigma-70 factor, ECF subfamily
MRPANAHATACRSSRAWDTRNSAWHLWSVVTASRVATSRPSSTVAQAISGDEGAFARIVAEHHEDMRRVCAVVCGDDSLADEAVQAAWPIAWQKLGSIRDPERLRPWLVSVAVNEVKQLLRQRRRRRDRVEFVRGSERWPGGNDPAQALDVVDLRAALDRLGTDDRALLAMRYVAGFNATELSAALGISPSGVRNRLDRLLDRLRKELTDG